MGIKMKTNRVTLHCIRKSGGERQREAKVNSGTVLCACVWASVPSV